VTTMHRRPIRTRSQLLSVLTEACELEHGLACSYLFAAFSIRDQEDGVLDAPALVAARKWAGQLYIIAAQEMLHLAQVWNLLVAVGGTPYYLRPNFPQKARYYPLNVPLELDRFEARTLQRFLAYERPRTMTLPWPSFALPAGEPGAYETVGDLYERVAEALSALPENELFVGAPARQTGPALVDFPDILRVIDRSSALQAVNLLTVQGEGTLADRADCHFGLFYRCLDELSASTFDPARPVLSNPAAKNRGDYSAASPNVVSNPYAAEVMDLFDDVYQLMLRALSFVFTAPSSHPLTHELSRLAIALMPVVVKPLGEAITELPAGDTYPGKSAGPAFGMSRHLLLPDAPRAARIVVVERLRELAEQGTRLAVHPSATPRLRRSVRNLEKLVATIPANTGEDS
jgi:hypothetical protein